MAKEELIAGFRNAIDRGFSIEEAKNSFLNAGYNPKEIEEAAEMSTSTTPLLYTNQPQLQPAQEQQTIQQPQSHKSSLIIAIIIALLVLIISIITLLFKNKILSIVKSLIG